MFGGVAGYRPRVRSAYYERVYVHSPERHIKHSNQGGRAQEALSEAGHHWLGDYCVLSAYWYA